MYNNYFFLSKLAAELNVCLTGTTLAECFTQNKKELTFTFSNGTNLIAILHSGWSLLRAPKNVSRAGKNTVDIFPEILNQEVLAVEIIHCDRSLMIKFTGFTLLFKLHGALSNVVLFEKDKVHALFIQSIEKDKTIEISSLGKSRPDFDFFRELNGEIAKVFPVIGKEYIRKLKEKGYDEASLEEKWSLFNASITELESANNFSVITNNNSISLYVGEQEGSFEVKEIFTSAIEAVEYFFLTKIKSDSFHSVKSALLRKNEQRASKLSSYLKKTEDKLQILLNADPHKYIADVIMANLHALSGREQQVVLQGFHEDEVVIDFKGKSPAKFAENLYRKSKNRNLEINKTKEVIGAKENELYDLLELNEEIKEITDYRELKKFQKINPVRENKQKAAPFHRIEHQNFVILIGKNDKGNEKMTFQEGYKEDLWLHVKDSPGSHVLIKHQAGKDFPKDVIEMAASEAAFFSKRKTESWVPVIYTPRKFVRKLKGGRPGQVIVEKEKTLLVQPVSELRKRK